MNIRLRLAALAAVLALILPGLHAQVPQLINYQGRVAVGAVNFNGSGAFKFALVNAAGTATYWSNDGSSTAGSEPAAAVTLTVTKGLYSVLLGDTTLASMTAIPNSVFANSDVRLRVWFNDGTNGSQLLTPDQRLAAVGYALMAGTVPDGAITGAKLATGAAVANILPGTLPGSLLAAGSIGASQLVAGDAPASGQQLVFDGAKLAWAKLAAALRNAAVILHADGTRTPYVASADTPAARGLALLAAFASHEDGETITLGPGTYELAGADYSAVLGKSDGTFLGLKSRAQLVGAGMDLTEIKLANSFGANSPTPRGQELTAAPTTNLATMTGSYAELNGRTLPAMTTITGFGTIAAGTVKTLRVSHPHFSGGVTLAHSGTLTCPGGVNLVTQNGSVLVLTSSGGGAWTVTSHTLPNRMQRGLVTLVGNSVPVNPGGEATGYGQQVRDLSINASILEQAGPGNYAPLGLVSDRDTAIERVKFKGYGSTQKPFECFACGIGSSPASFGTYSTNLIIRDCVAEKTATLPNQDGITIFSVGGTSSPPGFSYSDPLSPGWVVGGGIFNCVVIGAKSTLPNEPAYVNGFGIGFLTNGATCSGNRLVNCSSTVNGFYGEHANSFDTRITDNDFGDGQLYWVNGTGNQIIARNTTISRNRSRNIFLRTESPSSGFDGVLISENITVDRIQLDEVLGSISGIVITGNRSLGYDLTSSSIVTASAGTPIYRLGTNFGTNNSSDAPILPTTSPIATPLKIVAAEFANTNVQVASHPHGLFTCPAAADIASGDAWFVYLNTDQSSYVAVWFNKAGAGGGPPEFGELQAIEVAIGANDAAATVAAAVQAAVNGHVTTTPVFTMNAAGSSLTWNVPADFFSPSPIDFIAYVPPTYSAGIVSYGGQTNPPAGPKTIDGVVVSSGIVWLKAQATAANNGYWNIQAGEWTRPTAAELKLSDGVLVRVTTGATLANRLFYSDGTTSANSVLVAVP